MECDQRMVLSISVGVDQTDFGFHHHLKIHQMRMTTKSTIASRDTDTHSFPCDARLSYSIVHGGTMRLLVEPDKHEQMLLEMCTCAC